MIIAAGEKVHVITRRNFKEDLRRHFAGEITAASDALIRVEGYAFIFNATTLEYRKRPELRTRIFGLGAAQLIFMVLPQAVSLEDLHYHTFDGRLVVTDGSGFSLDINEFSHAS